MCGIAGRVDFAAPVDPELVQRMCTAITHRGPDARGTFVEGGVGLGIQRLAIIDVAGGDQPIFNETGDVAVVLNGEIYNYLELRRALLELGHRFTTESDTEVLVHLYEAHGEELVHHLRGMFAFAIWDRRRRRLFCARDRVGKKPLFWAKHPNGISFGSEISALLQDPDIPRTVDLEAICAYLAYQYVPHPLSAFSAIRKLPPASTLTVTSDGVEVRRYWSLDYSRKLEGIAEPELARLVWDELRTATRIRLMSEVPLGAFLSGGIDSSAVVAAMAEEMREPVKTFSIGFPDDEYDELPFARAISQQFGTDHHEFRVDPDALAIMPLLARHYGEPFADPSAIPSFYLAQMTRRHVTVALNGDGGDESFAGYRRYVDADHAPHFDWLPGPAASLAGLIGRRVGPGRAHSGLRTKGARLAQVLRMSPAERYAASRSAFDDIRRRRLLTPELAAATEADVAGHLTAPWSRSSAEHRIESMMATDVETYLPDDLLVKMDIATMAYSVEARSPFLDHHMMELAASIPVHLKHDGRVGKRVLRAALEGVLPAEVLNREKKGFAVPLARWFREDLRSLPEEVLLDPRTLERGYFRREEIESLISEHRERAADHSLRLWVLLQLETWHREVVEAPLESGAPGPHATVRGAPS